MSYPFNRNDGGRISSKRPKQKEDCTVRALAIAADLAYDKAYDLLKYGGRKSHQGFNFRAWVDGKIINGYSFKWKSFPAQKGERRMNPVTFCNQYKKGRFILRTAKHVFAVIDGVVHDTFKERNDRCVYAMWKGHKEI